ncbi:hypothetical protein DY000_02031974 [Brassica cretica]|uniref:POX domain-containing protein n=1 Tax=Brassica cretica TaxID=69181 RepID=A0ABQ7DX65_BRACR|nr:hypothetical protein DY000_02031974 [Brassica cretica]
MAVYYPTSTVGMQSLYQEPIYLNEQASSSSAGAGANCLEISNSVPNEMVFIPPTSDTSLNGNVTVSSNDLSFHGGGLSLSLGNQIQYHYQNLSNQLSYNEENGKSHHHQHHHQVPSFGFYNNGFVSSVLRSRYLKPTQQLLDEVVSVKKTKDNEKGQDFTNGSKPNDTNNTENNEELSPSERQELQSKKNKLLTMVDEVDKSPLTVPSDCIHIRVLDGFWDTIEPRVDTGFLLFIADGYTSWRVTLRDSYGASRIDFINFDFGDSLPRHASFLDAEAPLRKLL